MSEIKVKIVSEGGSGSDAGNIEQQKQTGISAKSLLKLSAIAGGIYYLSKASPQLSSSLALLNKGFMAQLRPVGDTLSQFVRPMAISILTDAKKRDLAEKQKQIRDKKIEDTNIIIKEEIKKIAPDITKGLEIMSKETGLQLQDVIKNSPLVKGGADLTLSQKSMLNAGEIGKDQLSINALTDLLFSQKQSQSAYPTTLGAAELADTTSILTKKIDDIFLGIDSKEAADKLKLLWNDYLSAALGVEIASTITNDAYTKFINDVYSKEAAKILADPNSSFSEKMKVLSTLTLYGPGGGQLAGFTMSTINGKSVTDNLKFLSNLATSKTGDTLEAQSNKTIEETKNKILEGLKPLENFSISLPGGGSFNPFSGILTAIAPAWGMIGGIGKMIADFFIDDGIITKDGKVIKTNPNDTIYASKNGAPGGANISTMNVNITISQPGDKEYKRIAEEVMDAISREISYGSG